MPASKPHYLYKVTNQVNGKLYIGVTSDLEHRKQCHLRYHSQDRLVNKAVKKYGAENFSFDVVCVGSRSYIYDLETKAISLYNSLVSGHGYNLSPGGEGGRGGKRGPVESRSDDKFTFVSGFWFPNKRTAMKSLNWGIGIYAFRKRQNVLGEVSYLQERHGPQNPVYVSGFWFSHKKQALNSLGWTHSKYNHRQRLGQLAGLTLIKNSKKVKNNAN